MRLPTGRGMALKILYRNPRQSGEAGIKLVPDRSRRAAEREMLEALGFVIIDITPSRQAPYAAEVLSKK